MKQANKHTSQRHPYHQKLFPPKKNFFKKLSWDSRTCRFGEGCARLATPMYCFIMAPYKSATFWDWRSKICFHYGVRFQKSEIGHWYWARIFSSGVFCWGCFRGVLVNGGWSNGNFSLFVCTRYKYYILRMDVESKLVKFHLNQI